MLTSTWLRDIVLLFLAIGIFFIAGLGARPYLTPSEARYIEIPRQMIVTGDWLTPRINGVPYFEKPPLFYWMQAVTMQLFGMGEFAGRLTTAKLAALTCLLAYGCARLLYGRRAGLASAMVLATCLLGYGLSRIALLDLPVAFFLTGCLASFMAAQRTEGKWRRNFYLLMYVAAGLAVMTKGLIGMVIPGLVIGTWILLTRQWHILKEARLFSGLIIFLLITAPWHVLMAGKHPEFLDFYFIHEHFTRYVSAGHRRSAPWWFFIAITLVGLLPWTALLPSAIRRQCARPLTSNPTGLFLLLWVLLPLIFFSTSQSKLIPYIYVIFPPLAILLGHYLAGIWEKEIPAKALYINAALVLTLFASALLLYAFLPPAIVGKDSKLAIPELPLLTLLPLMMALAALAFTLILRRPRQVAGALAGFAVILALTVNFTAASLDRATIKPLAMIAKERLQEGDRVVAYGSYFQDLPVYLNRNITVADWQGELEFGITHYPDTRQWMISADEFRKNCAGTAPLYVFIKRSTLDASPLPAACGLRVIAEYGKNVLMEKGKP